MQQNSEIRRRRLFTSIILTAILGAMACSDSFDETIAREKIAAQLPLIIDTGPDGPDSSWTIQSSPVASRRGAASAVIDRHIYIYGGEDPGIIRNDFWRYNVLTGDAERLASHESRSYATLSVVGQKIYLYGGKSDIPYDATQSLSTFDIVMGIWQYPDSQASVPPQRYMHTATICPAMYNSIYITGGLWDETIVDSLLHRAIVSEDASAVRWEQLRLPLDRGDHGACCIGDTIYYYGGFSDTDGYIAGGTSLALYNIITGSLQYPGTDPTSNTDEIVSPGGRRGIDLIAIGQYIYLYGGQGIDGFHQDLWQYSVAENRWRRLSDGPAPLSDYTAAAVNGEIYFIGGYRINQEGREEFSDEMWIYSPEIDSLNR